MLGAVPGSFRIARVFGIDVRVHFSWVFIFLLFTYQQSLEFDASYPSWSAGKTVIVGAITAFLFFASVVLHELAHSLVARRFKMTVSSITLFLLGGVASLTREPPTAQAEFLMAAAGPAASVGVSGLAWVASALLGSPQRETFAQVAKAVCDSLSQINLLVAGFNLIPGFPLDGGRVLRSTIWGITRNQGMSTRIAARGGQIVAGLFALGAAYVLIVLGESAGLWYFLIAYFLYSAASQSLRQEELLRSMSGARVAQVATTEFPAVPRGTFIGTLVRDYFLPRDMRSIPFAELRAVPVVDDGRFAGLVTIADLRKIEQDQWPTTLVDAVMTPASDVPSVTPDEPLGAALEKFGDELPLLPVVRDGTLVGVLTRDALAGYVRTRQMLGFDRR
jgi:Zn-dependent protease/CBS domain-containing protein